MVCKMVVRENEKQALIPAVHLLFLKMFFAVPLYHLKIPRKIKKIFMRIRWQPWPSNQFLTLGFQPIYGCIPNIEFRLPELKICSAHFRKNCILLSRTLFLDLEYVSWSRFSFIHPYINQINSIQMGSFYKRNAQKAQTQSLKANEYK